MSDPLVDVVILTRDHAPLDSRVEASLRSQRGVTIRVHRVVGEPLPSDSGRWQTIARARNQGKRLGRAPWLMFLDDDVVLGGDTIARLLDELKGRPRFGALAADYLRQKSPSNALHVGMGATLFRRRALDDIQFRFTDTECECQCCCNDLRRAFWGIDYSAKATAEHIELTSSQGDAQTSEDPTSEASVLTAFDARHVRAFEHRFLRSFRERGNAESVHAVVYDLPSAVISRLSRLEGVTVHPCNRRWGSVARDRLTGFQRVLQTMRPTHRVAYWDAGDVLFQSTLTDLWKCVANQPQKLIVSEEPMLPTHNGAYLSWFRAIANAEARDEALSVVLDKPILNGGFVAGTASRVLEYLQLAERKAASFGPDLHDHGVDQMVMNLLLTDQEKDGFSVGSDWNYCLAGRHSGHYAVWHGVYWDSQPTWTRIPVVHGNAGTMTVSATEFAMHGPI